MCQMNSNMFMMNTMSASAHFAEASFSCANHCGFSASDNSIISVLDAITVASIIIALSTIIISVLVRVALLVHALVLVLVLLAVVLLAVLVVAKQNDGKSQTAG